MSAPSVALLFGVPLSRDEFEELACAEHFWDYGHMLGANRSNWAARFDAHYAPVTQVVADLYELATQRGYRVVQRATLPDVAHACIHQDIVIVTGHWKSSHVLAADLLPGWENALRRLLEAPVDRVERVIAAQLVGIPLQRQAVSHCLNMMIRTHALRPYMPGGLDAEVEAGTLLLETISRELCDRAFAGYLRCGNCLELRDGLHTAWQIKDAIGDVMPAVLDLSCCTSTVLATYLREGGAGHVIGGSALVIPAPHLRMLHWVLSKLDGGPDAYLNLRLAVPRALRDGFDRGTLCVSALEGDGYDTA